MTIRLHPLSSPLTLEMDGPLTPPAPIQREVDALWDLAKEERPHLFDGPMVTVLEMTPPRLRLARASYRYVAAARRAPKIAQALGLRPLAVTGVLVCPEGVVFARRGGAVTQGPGRWELGPSGGLESAEDPNAPPDPAAHLLVELAEELGLRPDQARVLTPVGLAENVEDGVIDIVMPLLTPLTPPQILAAHADHRGEYEAVEIIEDLARFCAAHPLMLPESHAIASQWGNSLPDWRRQARALR